MAQPKIDKNTLEQVRDRMIAALARVRAAAESAAPPAGRRVCFDLRAADGGKRRLPDRLLSSAGDDAVQTSFQREAEALIVTLEALGAPSIQRLRQRSARLLSADGRVDFSFRFDKRGGAQLRLSPAPEIEDSLAYGFDLDVRDEIDS